MPDDLHSARREIDDTDVLAMLDRCYRVIHEISRTSKSNDHEDDAQYIVRDGENSAVWSPKSYVKRYLTVSVFDTIKKRQTRIDHNIFDVVWPSLKRPSTRRVNEETQLNMDGGVIAPDFDVFVVFQEFLVPLIKDLHGIGVSGDFHPHPETQFFLEQYSNGALNENIDANTSMEIGNIHLDRSGKFVAAGTIECCRNLEEYELPLNLTIGQLEHVERVLTAKLLHIDFSKTIDETEVGTYYTMNEILDDASEIRKMLAAKGLLIPLFNTNDAYQKAESVAMNGRYWPYARGVYVGASCDFVVWVNCMEHVRVLCCTNNDAPANIGPAYIKMGKAIMYFTEQLELRNSYFLGYLTSRPSYLGTALHFTLTLNLPHLTREPNNLRHMCNVRGLHVTQPFNSSNVKISNRQALSLTEWKIFRNFATAAMNIIQLEKDLSVDTTNNIASMFLNIFRRKQSNAREK